MQRPTALASLLAVASLSTACASPEVVGILPFEDAYVDQALPDENFGADPHLVIGDASPWEPSAARILFKFDLSNLPSDPRQIRKVELLAYQDEAEPELGYQSCDIHFCTSVWSEGSVTWNTGVEFDERIWATAIAEEANLHDWVRWDVTALVLAQQALEIPNLGWLIKGPNEGSIAARRTRFRNGESALAKDEPARLRATIWPLLWDSQTLLHNQPVSTRITGLVPGQEVHLYMSLTGEGSTPVDELEVPVALDQPIKLGTGTAAADGSLLYEVVAPPGTEGKSVWLQAVSERLRSNVANPEVR